MLHTHPGIADVAVVGVPSARWGETPLAIVVKKNAALTDQDVLGFCDGKLARFKQPKAVRFIDLIPRNASGKPLKHVLRKQFADAGGS